jgi:hypothetical protein
MKLIYVSVIATRRKTLTVRCSIHRIPMGFRGPQRAIESFSSRLAGKFTGDWELNVMQITQHEYQIFKRKLNLEKAAI